MFEIGRKEDCEKHPIHIEISGRKYFLTLNSEGYKLISRVCPHQGATIECNYEKDEFFCPVHQWRFDNKTGKSLNSKQQSLTSYDVVEKDGFLYVDIDLTNDIRERKTKVTSTFPTIKLHAHACIEIIHDNFHLLCDPWLEGPAFLGAWLQYPTAGISVDTLKPDAVWISHEHSDHFHVPTLKKIDKSIPIYIPSFPNKRMETILADLGFTNIYVMRFGKKNHISKDISITTYEPQSLWNDAFVLIEVGDFKFLNLNDGGINQRIAKEIGTVDVIASSFSSGASGYPLTWKHIDLKEKETIMRASRQGILNMLEQAATMYGAKYILPFASHFTLWRPEHDKYMEQLLTNKVEDVVNYFKNKPIEVVNILPGGEWNTQTNSVINLTQQQNRLDYVNEMREQINWSEVNIHLHRNVSYDELKLYFIQLNEIPEMIFCEDLTCHVVLVNQGEITVELYFEVSKGKLEIKKSVPNEPNITMRVPENIMRHIVDYNESWDEAIIGYWCEFKRYPDIYHADFWRILQAPYYRKQMLTDSLNSNSAMITKDSVIAEVIERYKDGAERILGRYGLYCTGCQYSIYETIAQGASSHGLTEVQCIRLVVELNRMETSRCSY